MRSTALSEVERLTKERDETRKLLEISEYALAVARDERDAYKKAEAENAALRAALVSMLALATDTTGWCECDVGDMCCARRDAAAMSRAALARVKT